MIKSLEELKTDVTTNGIMLINLLIQELEVRFEFELNLYKAQLMPIIQGKFLNIKHFLIFHI